MQAIPTRLPEVFLLTPTLHGDARGFFYESFNQKRFETLTGHPGHFVQDNHSRSRQYVLRGLHYQIHQSQAKLVRVLMGEIFDVAVDLRRSSPHFGQWAGATLSAENKQQLFIPEGFAHGFLVLSETAEVLYKTSDYYAPEHERSIRWDDPKLNIAWPLPTGISPALSAKDAAGVSFAQADLFG